MTNSLPADSVYLGERDKAVAGSIDRIGSTFPVNEFVAARLREAADLLAAQQDNPFRAAAYRRASDAVASLDHSVDELLKQGGVEALDRIPHVGKGIAGAVAQMVAMGKWPYLQRLRGSSEPEDVFCAIPGVGPKLAKRLHEELQVATLEQLEAALADPKSPAPKGVGKRRASMIRSGLRQLLDRVRPRRGATQVEPSVETLLDIDREYREKAALDVLPRIAPKRFNPESKAWLPVLHTNRGPWHFTALHSNTSRAHELGRVWDWVVIYFHDDDHGEGQRTIVTETRGPLLDCRVVRGREAECLALRETTKAPAR